MGFQVIVAEVMDAGNPPTSRTLHLLLLRPSILEHPPFARGGDDDHAMERAPAGGASAAVPPSNRTLPDERAASAERLCPSRRPGRLALYAEPTRDQELLMIPSCLRTFAMFPVLFAIGACGTSTPEAVRPAPDGSTPVPIASGADIPRAPATELVMSQDVCQSDADCVPAACCHASACMRADNVKPCNVMCTQVCEPGTIDCGGGCLCHHGLCAARLGNGGK